MVIQLRPSRGGYLRPFGCGWFIREFLLGHGLIDIIAYRKNLRNVVYQLISYLTPPAM